MARTVDPKSLIALPHLTAESADTLARQLVTVAGSRKLAAPIAASKDRLEGARQALEKARGERFSSSDSTSARAADRDEDASMACLYGFLQALARLPHHDDDNAQAEKLLQLLFPDGLSFTKLPFVSEHAEVEDRLKTIKDQKLEAGIKALGGARFLDSIKTSHKAYGEALGVTKAKPAAAPTANVRAPLAALFDAIRDYVFRVSGHVTPDSPASQTEADALLEPFVNWVEPARAKKPAKPDAPAGGGGSAPKAAPGGKGGGTG